LGHEKIFFVFCRAIDNSRKQKQGKNIMTIYIATTINGRGIRHIASFPDKQDYRMIAWQWLDRSDNACELKRSSNIDEICHCLRDHGPGFGARYHNRISRKQALKLQKDGVETYGY
jgi:hypothetical protein